MQVFKYIWIYGIQDTPGVINAGVIQKSTHYLNSTKQVYKIKHYKF